MKLYNSLSHQVESFQPIDGRVARIYSCGPTVYDHVHIGNLSAFIVADTLRRIIAHHYPGSRHIMNLTDVDDKTIKRSALEHPDKQPRDALSATTGRYSEVFFSDMEAVGNAVSDIDFMRATDQETINDIRALIARLHGGGFAYIADDGVYFSIDAYKKSGKVYGQLVEITDDTTSQARIQNDEYSKESAHDFALWKVAREGEPSWDFTLDGRDITGRPGWHIECSAMSTRGLGVPFDIHTGGIDLKFPHHENEIAQSTAGSDDHVYAHYFVHNEHILVDGQKMAKSANNFYALSDLTGKQIDPLAFRMLVLQSHYRSPTNFSWENVNAAANRLNNWRDVAALRHQIHSTLESDSDKLATDSGIDIFATRHALAEALSSDLDTPDALKIIDEAFGQIQSSKLDAIPKVAFIDLLESIDSLLGLGLLSSTPDVSDSVKQLIVARQRARDAKDWQASDQARDELAEEGIAVRDTSSGPVWSYVSHKPQI